MECIEILKNNSLLEGTCYIELSLGKYEGRHWEETSLFFGEEIFGLIGMIFEKHIQNYDHYGMNDAGSESWRSIIIELQELDDLLVAATDITDIYGKVGFCFGGTRDYFQTHFEPCKNELREIVNELVEWSEKNIKRHGHIAVLGI